MGKYEEEQRDTRDRKQSKQENCKKVSAVAGHVV